MGLFEGVPAPVYVEPGQDKIRQEALGMERAKPFNYSFTRELDRIARSKESFLEREQQKKQFESKMAFEQKQFDAGSALRAAQLQSLQAKASIDTLNAAAAADWEQMGADALARESEIKAYTPEEQASFIRWVQAVDPKLAKTPWYGNVMDKFDTYRKLDQQHKNVLGEIEARAKGELEVQKARESATKARIEAQNAARVGVELYDPQTGMEIPGARQKWMEKNSQRGETIRSRNAEEFAQGLKENRPDLTESQVEDAKNRFFSNPNAINPDSATQKAIIADDEAARGLDEAFSNIQKFNAKFGPNAFDKFTGPIEGRIQKFKSEYKGFTSEDERLARQIESNVEQSVQGFRKGNFGTALTGTELARFKRIVDDPTSAAYLDTVRSFRESLKDSVARRVENYPYSTSLPPRIFTDYSKRKPGEWFMGDGKQQTAPPPGWKFNP